MNHVAIVLKQLSSHKVALLDKRRGRLDSVTLKPLCLGSLIHYAVEKERGSLMYLTDTQLVDLPFAIARADILFWHHVLELCFYFVPVGIYISQLFELCTFLYTVDTNACWPKQSKKIYLFKLLTTIGVYPHLPQLSLEKLDYFMSLPLTAIAQEILDEQHEKRLDEWLRICISDHPAIAKFKTIHYLLAA